MEETDNSLAALYPEIAGEWHSTKNPNDVTPELVAARSTKTVWWRCGNGHEWEAKVSSRTKLKDPTCPKCRSLAFTHPEISREWHPSKNEQLTASDVTFGSNNVVWWVCDKGHDYQLSIRNRVRSASKGHDSCPKCKEIDKAQNSVAARYPHLVTEWHPSLNADCTPQNVSQGSETKIWWKCKVEKCGHEWQSSPANRGRLRRGCPKCTGRILSLENSLQSKYPEIAKEWHSDLNIETPTEVAARSGKKAWWKCSNETHPPYQAVIGSRTKGSGCPYCVGLQACEGNSLEALFPEIAAEWHQEKNYPLTPSEVIAGTTKKVWWKCGVGEEVEGERHEWEASVVQRTRSNSGCPFCSGRIPTLSKSLAQLNPELATEWDYQLNGSLKPEHSSPGSGQKVWWRCKECPDDHYWDATVASRNAGNGCPFCANKRAGISNSLRTTHPELAAEWYAEKNGELTPDNVTAGSAKKVWWKCSNGDDHIWQASINKRRMGRGCPRCNQGWTLDNIRHFVRSLLDQDLLEGLSRAELWVLFQQNGLISSSVQRRNEFVKAFASGRLPFAELDKFANGEESKLNPLFGAQTADDILEKGVSNREEDVNFQEPDSVDERNENLEADDDLTLPKLTATKVLDTLESDVWSVADEEAVEFLIASGVSKLWKLAYSPEHLDEVIVDTNSPRKAEYSERVRSQFRLELEAAQSLSIPDGYSFKVNNTLAWPNLMQRHVTALVKDRQRVGNWSGTGAGKTLSAVLASRVIGSHLTIILCPNSTIQGWKITIENAFPYTQIETKTLSPQWRKPNHPKYLILNYETLQQRNSESKLATLLEKECPDFVVIDEIHYTKQRSEDASKRRRLTEALCSQAGESNPKLSILGMSATPVVNNLTEGVSMVNLITGVTHSDISTKSTVANCMKLHQHLVSIGTRWKPTYPEFRSENPRINIDDSIFEIKSIAKGSAGQLRLEQILIEKKLECILSEIEDGALIYTEYVAGIAPTLTKAISDAGWKVGLFTGQDKTGLKPFLDGKLNVLVGSSSIGTGVDGLQFRASKLIVACAPWTSAAYEQLIGRLVRQGQKQNVTVVYPMTYANVGGEEWSWCESRLNRIKYKKSVADAAVDGVVPTGQLRTSAQAFSDALGWLKRLDKGEVTEIKRHRITVPLCGNTEENETRISRYGEFSSMNQRWNATRSDNLHKTLSESPEEWEHYHTLYRDARETWTVIPFEKIREFISKSPKNRVVGDFGCGEDLLGKELREKGYTVHSFDHVAISDDVIACDIGQEVPLADSEIDIAVFSLSLMGANTGTYLREAARTLVFDGRLIIAEPTSRLPDKDQVKYNLGKLGFHVTELFVEGQFSFIHACRNDVEPYRYASLFDK